MGDRRTYLAAALVIAAGGMVGLLGAYVIRTWSERNRVIEGQGYEGVIFNETHAARILEPMVSSDSHGYWTPTEADIRNLESALRDAAETHPPDGLHPLGDYRRQYFGYSLEGRRRILVIGFCDPNGLDWTRAFVSAGEGGCHFEATYDVRRQTLTSFWALDLLRSSSDPEMAAAGKASGDQR